MGIRRLFWCVLLGAGFLYIPVLACASEVVAIRLNGIVQPVSAEYVERGIQYANRQHAAAIILEINTPGGLDGSMRQIISAIFSSAVPVIGYVAPSGARAASAGFFILLSCDLAAMAPGTNTGAAHPVLATGAEPGKAMSQKIENDAAAYIRSIAARRHRNVSTAESGVLSSKSFSEQEALSNHLIDFVTPSLEALLAAVNGRTVLRLNGDHQTLYTANAHVFSFDMSVRERVLYMDPSLAFVLLLAGVAGLYIEFTHPGVVLPGVFGAIAIVIALFALSFLPINWAAAGLLILAFVLFALEAKFASHGILASGGVAALIIGAVLLIDSPIPEMRIRLGIAIAVALPIALITVFLMRLVIIARRRKAMSGKETLIGEQGVARTELAAEGMVFVQGQLWRAHASREIHAGEKVRVVAVNGLLLEVEPV